MDKELKKMIEELAETLKDVIPSIEKDMDEALENAFGEEAKISIKTKKDGCTEIHSEGKTFAILIALAGLEQNILKELKVPNTIWEKVKRRVGSCKL